MSLTYRCNCGLEVLKAQRWVHERTCGSSQGLVVHESPQLVVHTKHGKYADLEARRAYRREWMRKKRANKEVS